MMKESILFVVSAGFLVYFIAPTGEEKAPPIPQDQSTKPQPVVEEFDEDEEWENDEGEDEEKFVFGQPMTGADDDADEESNFEAESETVEKETASSKTTTLSSSNRRASAFAKTPKEGEPGSSSNPIALSRGKRSE